MSKKPHFLAKNSDFGLFEIENKKSGRVTFLQLMSRTLVPSFMEIRSLDSEISRYVRTYERTNGTETIGPSSLQLGTKNGVYVI